MKDEVWLALKILNASVGNFAKLVIIKKNKNSNPTLDQKVYLSGEYNLPEWIRDPTTNQVSQGLINYIKGTMDSEEL